MRVVNVVVKTEEDGFQMQPEQKPPQKYLTLAEAVAAGEAYLQVLAAQGKILGLIDIEIEEG